MQIERVLQTILNERERFAVELTCEILGNILNYWEEEDELPINIPVEDLENTLCTLNELLDKAD